MCVLNSEEVIIDVIVDGEKVGKILNGVLLCYLCGC